MLRFLRAMPSSPGQRSGMSLDAPPLPSVMSAFSTLRPVSLVWALTDGARDAAVLGLFEQ